jgi:hypothetical protein
LKQVNYSLFFIIILKQVSYLIVTTVMWIVIDNIFVPIVMVPGGLAVLVLQCAYGIHTARTKAEDHFAVVLQQRTKKEGSKYDKRDSQKIVVPYVTQREVDTFQDRLLESLNEGYTRAIILWALSVANVVVVLVPFIYRWSLGDDQFCHSGLPRWTFLLPFFACAIFYAPAQIFIIMQVHHGEHYLRAYKTRVVYDLLRSLGSVFTLFCTVALANTMFACNYDLHKILWIPLAFSTVLVQWLLWLVLFYRQSRQIQSAVSFTRRENLEMKRSFCAVVFFDLHVIKHAIQDVVKYRFGEVIKIYEGYAQVTRCFFQGVDSCTITAIFLHFYGSTAPTHVVHVAIAVLVASLLTTLLDLGYFWQVFSHMWQSVMPRYMFLRESRRMLLVCLCIGYRAVFSGIWIIQMNIMPAALTDWAPACAFIFAFVVCAVRPMPDVMMLGAVAFLVITSILMGILRGHAAEKFMSVYDGALLSLLRLFGFGDFLAEAETFSQGDPDFFENYLPILTQRVWNSASPYLHNYISAIVPYLIVLIGCGGAGSAMMILTRSFRFGKDENFANQMVGPGEKVPRKCKNLLAKSGIAIIGALLITSAFVSARLATNSFTRSADVDGVSSGLNPKTCDILSVLSEEGNIHMRAFGCCFISGFLLVLYFVQGMATLLSRIGNNINQRAKYHSKKSKGNQPLRERVCAVLSDPNFIRNDVSSKLKMIADRNIPQMHVISPKLIEELGFIPHWSDIKPERSDHDNEDNDGDDIVSRGDTHRDISAIVEATDFLPLEHLLHRKTKVIVQFVSHHWLRS